MFKVRVLCGISARDGSGSLLKAKRSRCASEEATSGSHRSGCNGRRAEAATAPAQGRDELPARPAATHSPNP